MAMIAAESFGEAGLQYLGKRGVKAIADKMENVIANAGMDGVNSALGSLFPGKKHKAKRNAVKRELANRRGRGGNTRAPVAINRVIRDVAPKFRSASGSYVVSNREFVANVNGNPSFQAIEFPIQPGLTRTFPWLAKIASTHQKYRFKTLKFEYVPVAGTGERGRITMAYAHDPLDESVQSKTELFQYPTSIESSIWSPSTLNCAGVSKQLFTRIGVVENTDLKTYDAGKVIVAASNTDEGTTAVIGELFVEYTIELSIPQPAKPLCTVSRIDCTAEQVNADFLDYLAPRVGVKELVGADWAMIRNATTGESYIQFRQTGVYHISVRSTYSTPREGAAELKPINDDGTITIHNELRENNNGAGTVHVYAAIVVVNSVSHPDGTTSKLGLFQPNDGDVTSELLNTLFYITEAQANFRVVA